MAGNCRKIKVCFFHTAVFDHNLSNNLFHITLRMADLLGESGEIHFLYAGEMDTRNLRHRRIVYHNVPAVKFPIAGNIWNYLALNRAICRVSEEYGIDCYINLNNHYFILLLLPGILLSRARLVARVVGIRTEKPHSIFQWIRRRIGIILENVSLTSCQQIVVLSSSLEKLLNQRSLLPLSHKIVLVSQGIDIEKFRPGLGLIPKAHIEFLFVGRLSKLKGVQYALQAFKMIHEIYPYTRFIIVGEGEEREFLEKFTAQENIQNAVEFRGHLDQDTLARVYRKADVFVIPSLSEGLPNVVLEAQASGLPVIGTKVDGIPELLDNGMGILVPPCDKQKLFWAMEILIKDANLRRIMAKKARKYVVENHSFECLRQSYLEIFRG